MKKIFYNKYSEPALSIGLLLLRIVAGSAMLVNHGLMKLTKFDVIAAKGFADPFHIGSRASLGLAVFAEAACAAFIIIGLFTRLATIPLLVTMIVAFFIAHHGRLFGEGESAAIFLVIFTFILLAGPGKYSIDRAISK